MTTAQRDATDPPDALDEVFEALRAPLRADAAANRDKLLASATTLFNHGDAEASLERIAEHAGVGVGTAYRRFPTRQHLLLFLFAKQLNTVLQRIDAALLDPAPRPAFVQFCFDAVPLMHDTNGLVGQLTRESRNDHVLRAAKARLVPALDRLVARERASLQPGFAGLDLLVVLLMCEKPFGLARKFSDRPWQPFMGIMLRGMVREPSDWVSYFPPE